LTQTPEVVTLLQSNVIRFFAWWNLPTNLKIRNADIWTSFLLLGGSWTILDGNPRTLYLRV
jgi:hypothetical protein